MRLRSYMPRLSIQRLITLVIVLSFTYSLLALSGIFPNSTRNARAKRQQRASGEKRYADYQVRSDKVDAAAAGENGAGVVLKGDDQARFEKLFKKEAFNIIASDQISFQRSVPDVRDQECKKIQYDADLPSASVIIIFHNEAWSPLLRTVWSVINRSPPEYLKEIILLDDFSDREELHEKLEAYVAENFDSTVVKIVRAKSRQGLISARVRGAEAATGDVVIFLDSHCEANVGWLEPILQRIKDSPTTMVCPMIDHISDHSMAYSGGGGGSIGGFWWSLHFKWVGLQAVDRKKQKSSIEPFRLEPLLQRIKDKPHHVLCPMVDAISDQSMAYSLNGGSASGGFLWSLHFTWESVKKTGKSTDPIRSPTMAGGLFAADRKWFFEVGAYDEGMDVWGGENLEISFRVWMCHGALEFIPCSRVGHIFRASHPYTFHGRDGVQNKDTHGINSARLAEVWMDDYKRLFYMHRLELEKNKTAFGDFSGRQALRKKLKCHDFKWYLDNVYPEKFIPDEKVLAYGQVKNPKTTYCLDMLGKDEKEVHNIGAYHCQGHSSAQFFSLSVTNQLRREENCADVASASQSGVDVKMRQCHDQETQKWTHEQNGQIKHKLTGLCLDTQDVANAGDLKMRTCADVSTQKWSFEHYDELWSKVQP